MADLLSQLRPGGEGIHQDQLGHRLPGCLELPGDLEGQDAYAKAYAARSPGLQAFLEAKRRDKPDLGQAYFVQSYRHQWEADLWKLLAQMRKYRDMLEQ